MFVLFKDVLRQLREGRGMTQEQLAEVLGVTAGTIGNYEQGQRLPKDDKMWIKIANYFNVSIDYLMDVERDDEPKVISTYKANTKQSDAPVSVKRVPILGKIACGQPVYSPESADVYTTTNAKYNVDFALIASGDSMIGDGIFDGDIVLIKEQERVSNGEIAAVSILDEKTSEEEVTLKHVYYYEEKGKLVLQSSNSKYEPMVYIGEELNDIRILGKAILVQHEL